MSFRKLFKDKSGLDPLSRAFSLASVGLEYFRANILEENTIAVTPIKGYHTKRRKSRIATAWLDYYEFEFLKKKIIREYRIGPYFAEGFINELYNHSEAGVSYTAIALEFWVVITMDMMLVKNSMKSKRPLFKRKRYTMKIITSIC
jgi:hypothetical protein